MNIWPNWRKLWSCFGPARKVRVIEGDQLPEKLPYRDLVLVRDDGEDWSIGFRCPCGCGERLELMLLKGARPRWDVKVDDKRRPTLNPSVWRNIACRSHFWVKDGRIYWCE